MHVGMVVPFVIPFYTTGGVAMVNWAILRALRERGHTVTVYSLLNAPSDRIAPAVQAVTELGVELVVISVPPPSENDSKVFGCGRASGILTTEIESRPTPDVLFCYTVHALEAAHYCSIPKVCALVDLDFLVSHYRRLYYRQIPMSYGEMSRLHQQAQVVKQRMLELLKDCEGVVEHAHHHAVWLNQNGIPCSYCPTPVLDPAFPGWQRTSYPDRRVPKVVLVGHVGGIATLSGLYYLADEILPHIDFPVEFHIIGAETLPPDLAHSFLSNSDVIVRGFVPDIQKELFGADVVLVPTPIDLGFRTRIVEAFALGCCVVTHEANRLGMPELGHGANGLCFSTGVQAATFLKGITQDHGMRVLFGERARQTYEAMSSTEHVITKIEEVVYAHLPAAGVPR